MSVKCAGSSLWPADLFGKIPDGVFSILQSQVDHFNEKKLGFEAKLLRREVSGEIHVDFVFNLRSKLLSLNSSFPVIFTVKYSIAGNPPYAKIHFVADGNSLSQICDNEKQFLEQLEKILKSYKMQTIVGNLMAIMEA